MNIGEIMTSNPITVKAEDSLLAATKILKEKGFKHLPVTNGGGGVVGVVTDRDLKRASASDATTLEVHELLYLLDRVKIGEVMSKNPLTIKTGEEVNAAARIMVEHHIGCLPVLRDDRLAGIVTKGDLLKLLATQ